MPRKKRASLAREVAPDGVFNDITVATLIHQVMRCGKKGIAARLVYDALQIVQEKRKEEPVGLFKKALDNIKPTMEVRSRRIGGANYQVPSEVRPARRMALGMKWLVGSAKGRGEKTMSQRLATEILEALENRGNAVRKKEETHKMAEANRAFAHYRW